MHLSIQKFLFLELWVALFWQQKSTLLSAVVEVGLYTNGGIEILHAWSALLLRKTFK